MPYFKLEKRKFKVRVLFLEPFYGGSHKDFADGFIKHSRHDIDLHFLPNQFWKWRLRAAALWFAQNIDPRTYDIIVTTSMLRVGDLKLLWKDCPPILLYNHESQISYPVPPGQNMEYEFVMIDITNALAAEHMVFNSQTHYQNYFSQLDNVLEHFPQYRPQDLHKIVREKSSVLHPGCQFPGKGYKLEELETPPLIIWNHRWEFDKKPSIFFKAMDRILKKGIEFRLAILGENCQDNPKLFIQAKEKYGSRIVQYGYVSSKEEYIQWLRQGALVVSTAIQENFGISIVEATRHGCLPLLPRRLSYPEVIPEKFHKLSFYQGYPELVGHLMNYLKNPPEMTLRKELSESMAKFSWENMVDQYDDLLEKLHLRLQ